MMHRNKTLDNLRCFAMMWVIFVHSLYWGEFFTSKKFIFLMSFCLIEMPLFFFVTGAGNSFSKVESYVGFVKKRFARILLPYWVFAFISAVLSILEAAVFDSATVSDCIRIFISWLNPFNDQITDLPYLTWGLWFIPVYLCVVLLIPLLKYMYVHKLKNVFAFVLLAVFAAACLLHWEWLQTIMFYSIWVYIGLFYSEILAMNKSREGRGKLWLAAAVFFLVLCEMSAFGCNLDMQTNKFPPNMIFLAYSCLMIALLTLLIPYMDRLFSYCGEKKFVGRILNLYATRSLTVYLYQGFAFWIVIRVLKRMLPNTTLLMSMINAMICTLAVIPISALAAIIMGPVEDWAKKVVKKTG